MGHLDHNCLLMLSFQFWVCSCKHLFIKSSLVSHMIIGFHSSIKIQVRWLSSLHSSEVFQNLHQVPSTLGCSLYCSSRVHESSFIMWWQIAHTLFIVLCKLRIFSCMALPKYFYILSTKLSVSRPFHKPFLHPTSSGLID